MISDTHGLLRPQAIEALRGSELILHAGDVGKPEILDALKKRAPVVAVRGNVDKSDWANALRETAVAEAGGILLYVLHDLNALDLNPAAAGFHVVVSGHSHQPGKFERDWRPLHQSGECRPAPVPVAGDDGAPESAEQAVRGGICGAKDLRKFAKAIRKLLCSAKLKVLL